MKNLLLILEILCYDQNDEKMVKNEKNPRRFFFPSGCFLSCFVDKFLQLVILFFADENFRIAEVFSTDDTPNLFAF